MRSVAMAVVLLGCTHAGVGAAPVRRDAWVEPVHVEKHELADVDVSVMRVHLPSAAASQTISTHLSDWATASIASIERDAEDARSEEDVPPDAPRYGLRITCRPHVITDALVSIACDVATSEAGSHGARVAEVFNFAIDGDVARPIGLDDLFLDAKNGRAAVADACLEALRSQGAQWVRDGNVTDVRDMVDAFHLEHEKLVVTFSPYEVGPDAEGAHHVEIPLSSLRGIQPTWSTRLASIP